MFVYTAFGNSWITDLMAEDRGYSAVEHRLRSLGGAVKYFLEQPAAVAQKLPKAQALLDALLSAAPPDSRMAFDFPDAKFVPLPECFRPLFQFLDRAPIDSQPAIRHFVDQLQFFMYTSFSLATESLFCPWKTLSEESSATADFYELFLAVCQCYCFFQPKKDSFGKQLCTQLFDSCLYALNAANHPTTRAAASALFFRFPDTSKNDDARENLTSIQRFFLSNILLEFVHLTNAPVAFRQFQQLLEPALYFPETARLLLRHGFEPISQRRATAILKLLQASGEAGRVCLRNILQSIADHFETYAAEKSSLDALHLGLLRLVLDALARSPAAADQQALETFVSSLFKKPEVLVLDFRDPVIRQAFIPAFSRQAPALCRLLLIRVQNRSDPAMQETLLGIFKNFMQFSAFSQQTASCLRNVLRLWGLQASTGQGAGSTVNHEITQQFVQSFEDASRISSLFWNTDGTLQADAQPVINKLASGSAAATIVRSLQLGLVTSKEQLETLLDAPAGTARLRL